MSIRQLTQSMDIVSALDDEPNDEGGLSSSDLKAKFDEGGNIIKSFINGMLIPDINERIQDEVNSVTLESGNMPTGGVSGQVLTKTSGAPFDAEFRDPLTLVTTQNLLPTSATDARLGLAAGASLEGALNRLAGLAVARCDCSTAAGTAAKTAAAPGFLREGDSIVVVTFSVANTASAPTLNVGGTGAAPIYYEGVPLSRPGMLAAGAPHLFTFSSGRWNLLNPKVPPPQAYFGHFTASTASNAEVTVELGAPPKGIICAPGNGSNVVFTSYFTATLTVGTPVNMGGIRITPTATGFKAAADSSSFNGYTANYAAFI